MNAPVRPWIATAVASSTQRIGDKAHQDMRLDAPWLVVPNRADGKLGLLDTERRLKVTTDSNHNLPISPNLLNREFSVYGPDRVWVGDINIATDEGWLFLSVVIDLFSRQVAG